ncbi:MBL fold metallo-hydrolase RNA specificity domain-containing protein [Dokdonella ginsengisoli]|uniref:MBL fold metallo-hydrolase RNA specificity domain-containing protein n=1 Tax=Dokdonella ginsengisoli TaxID=363846 RepID=A0ABV9QWN6_9GAMM
MRIQFLGAAGTVTGSKYLLTSRDTRVLVDCGLFQGLKQLRLRNRAALPVEPASIAAVVLTHAHLDHSGYVPLLVRNGFRGPVYCTPATFELCRILLPDSGRLQEEDAAYANRRGFSKHHPPLPLYTEEDALASLRRFRPIGSGENIDLGGGLSARFDPAGHILGAAIVTLADATRRIVFSGDLGRPDDPLMRPPSPIGAADYLVVESTYGDRLHPAVDPLDEIQSVVTRTIRRGGVVVVPAFAVGRAQSLLLCLARLKAAQRIPPDLPVYLNSPMAVDVTGLYWRFRDQHRLDEGECAAMCHVAKYVNSVEESRHLNTLQRPMVIVAASGMATGGRVVHHLKAFAPDARNTILFSGYQAAGTRGASMLAGAASVRIHGQDVPVRSEVAVCTSLSAHADHAQIVQWLRHFQAAPRTTFVTHGEPVAADAMRQHVERELGWTTVVPDYRDGADLEGAGLDGTGLDREVASA